MAGLSALVAPAAATIPHGRHRASAGDRMPPAMPPDADRDAGRRRMRARQAGSRVTRIRWDDRRGRLTPFCTAAIVQRLRS